MRTDFGEETRRNRLLWRPKLSWECRIEMDLKEI